MGRSVAAPQLAILTDRRVAHPTHAHRCGSEKRSSNTVDDRAALAAQAMTRSPPSLSKIDRNHRRFTQRITRDAQTCEKKERSTFSAWQAGQEGIDQTALKNAVFCTLPNIRKKDGAVERTRTSTVLLPPAPQAGASASSATTAFHRRSDYSRHHAELRDSRALVSINAAQDLRLFWLRRCRLRICRSLLLRGRLRRRNWCIT